MVPPDGCAPPFPAHQAGVLLLDDREMEARVGTAPTILAYRARGFLVNLSSQSWCRVEALLPALPPCKRGTLLNELTRHGADGQICTADSDFGGLCDLCFTTPAKLGDPGKICTCVNQFRKLVPNLLDHGTVGPLPGVPPGFIA